jgi:hypothetical protein
MQVVVEIPDEFSSQILPAGQDPSRALLEDAALKAYCEERITANELRQILGLNTQYQLDGFLKERGIECGAYGPSDLQHDVQTIDRLRDKESQNSPS